MNHDKLKLKNQLCHRFYTASNAITRSYRPLLKSLELTYPQYVIMMALWETDNISIQEILIKTDIDGGSLTQILAKLKTKEIISITTDSTDKRKRLVKLTEKGEKLKLKASTIPDQMRCKVASLTDDEAVQLMQLIDKLNRELSNCSTEEASNQ